jgi:hypothetical protein
MNKMDKLLEMESPQNAIWGPALWTLLHCSAERVGSQHLKRLPQEESRIWINLLSSLRYSLPCPLCKKHYTAYFATHPIALNAIRAWLFHLHEQVNAQKTDKVGDAISTTMITIDNLPEIYGIPFQYTVYSKTVSHQMLLAVRKGICGREEVQRTIRCMEELRRFYDFF